ncbi:MAG: hypothetical protein ACOY5F_20050 [Pseudomonadota bacterium]
MKLSEGDAADADDVWYRIITDKKYLRADGRLRSSAFTGKAIAPPRGKRDWNHELSGRLLSLAGDVSSHAKAFCVANSKLFVGVMHSQVDKLRFEIGAVTSDVRYTPRPDDEAHADFVTYNSTEDDLPDIRDRLQEIVRVLNPTELNKLEAKRQTSDASPQPESAAD